MRRKAKVSQELICLVDQDQSAAERLELKSNVRDRVLMFAGVSRSVY